MELSMEQLKTLLADHVIVLRAKDLELAQSQIMISALREEIRKLQEEKSEEK
jgi:hypothetical protein